MSVPLREQSSLRQVARSRPWPFGASRDFAKRRLTLRHRPMGSWPARVRCAGSLSSWPGFTESVLDRALVGP
eukprot:1756416-Rhodomonas_salina.2